jgi:hypothetical protein
MLQNWSGLTQQEKMKKTTKSHKKTEIAVLFEIIKRLHTIQPGKVHSTLCVRNA